MNYWINSFRVVILRRRMIREEFTFKFFVRGSRDDDVRTKPNVVMMKFSSDQGDKDSDMNTNRDKKYWHRKVNFKVIKVSMTKWECHWQILWDENRKKWTADERSRFDVRQIQYISKKCASVHKWFETLSFQSFSEEIRYLSWSFSDHPLKILIRNLSISEFTLLEIPFFSLSIHYFHEKLWYYENS